MKRSISKRLSAAAAVAAVAGGLTLADATAAHADFWAYAYSYSSAEGCNADGQNFVNNGTAIDWYCTKDSRDGSFLPWSLYLDYT